MYFAIASQLSAANIGIIHRIFAANRTVFHRKQFFGFCMNESKKLKKNTLIGEMRVKFMLVFLKSPCLKPFILIMV
jgi:hypothetical protein